MTEHDPHFHPNYIKAWDCPPCQRCYWRGCRCTDCCRENTKDRRKYRRPDSDWDNPLIPIDEVRAHLKELKQQGVGFRSIARRTGLNESHMNKTLNDENKTHIRKQNADKILSITSCDTWVNSILSARKLSELSLEGISIRDIAKEVGVTHGYLNRLKNGLHRQMKRDLSNKILALKPSQFPNRNMISATRERRRLANLTQ